MTKHIICTFKELPLFNDKTVRNILNITNWAKWNSIKPIGSSYHEAYEINFGINSPTSFPVFKFSKTPTLTKNELKLETTLVSKKNLHIQWSILIKQNDDSLLVNTLLLNGSLAKAFFNEFAPSLRQALKQMNRDFLKHATMSALDRGLFLGNEYEAKLFLN